MPDEQRFVLGIAYMPGKDPRIAKGIDGGRDFFTEAELEKAAWSFLRNGPQVNAFHIEGTEDGYEAHHKHESGKTTGPHNHKNLQELKRGLTQFFNEEERED